jgi:FkbH-like protein
MYETEANARIESAQQIPAEALASFGHLRGRISSRTVLPWSEHCTECVWPTCYSTCDLYSPRQDGRCRRFVDGMVRIDCPSAINHYLLKIRFKQWGKLWTPGLLRLQSVHEAERLENRDRRIGNVLYQIPLPASLKKTAVTKRYSFKKRMAQRKGQADARATCFLLESFNPAEQIISLSLTIRSFQANHRMPFQKLINLQPGYNLVRVPIEEISSAIDLSSPFHVELIPNEIGKEITLFFGLMDFVQEVESATKQSKVKCVVWDLDRTLWDGILVEDGPQKVRLKPRIVEIVKELDRRGILQSISSKNNHDEVMQLLKEFGVDEFFLYPQVSWRPKSESLNAIAGLLNIGIDTLLFVDDSEFELQQVQSVHSKVRVVNASAYSSLLDRADCQSPVTEESKQRRKMYQVEQSRQQVASSFKDDYRAFLLDCDIHLEIGGLTEENLERVHELTQRTNQMNFSGNRYDRGLLREVLQNPHLDTYVLSCKDRFGHYGIIGFGIVENREPRLTDLMFSCRIQAKRVEHAFVSHVLRKYVSLTGRDFHANYRKTPRNAPSGQVFADMAMQETGVSDGVTQLVFRRGQEIPDDGIITLIVQDAVAAGSSQ